VKLPNVRKWPLKPIRTGNERRSEDAAGRVMALYVYTEGDRTLYLVVKRQQGRSAALAPYV